MTLTDEKAIRIGNMFLRGYSLDLISEWGLHSGWTREEAKSVVRGNGWALDWSGRLQDGFLGAEAGEAYTSRRQRIGDADVEKILSVGLDHEVPDIRHTAVKAQRAVDDLRRVLVLQEEKDAEEVARRRRAARQRQADPETWEHGKWGAFLRHKQHGVPVCSLCQAAADAYLLKADERSVEAPRRRTRAATRAS